MEIPPTPPPAPVRPRTAVGFQGGGEGGGGREEKAVQIDLSPSLPPPFSLNPHLVRSAH